MKNLFFIIGTLSVGLTTQAKTLNPCASLKATPHLLSLEMGDESCDGHCLKETLLACASIAPKDLAKAYAKGSKTLDFDITDEVAEFEDSSVKAGQMRAIAKAGTPIPFAQLEIDEASFAKLADDADVSLSTEAYARLYLGTAKAGVSELKFEFIDLGPTQGIGGYGLFSP
ncbi:MAG TPA: hypothetical protein VM901_01100 [Bdellovibrionota bacterium]|jgi:hypothetical protein|nr:hypothetical protein [Bdellovibrionota bacterium]